MRNGVSAQVGNKLRNVLVRGKNTVSGLRPGAKATAERALSGLVEEFSAPPGRRLGLGSRRRRPGARRPLPREPQGGLDVRHRPTAPCRATAARCARTAARRPPRRWCTSGRCRWCQGPADDRRNSNQSIRTFSFRIREIWPWVKKGTRITVRVDGQPLPIYGHGMFLNPPAQRPPTRSRTWPRSSSRATSSPRPARWRCPSGSTPSGRAGSWSSTPRTRTHRRRRVRPRRPSSSTAPSSARSARAASSATTRTSTPPSSRSTPTAGTPRPSCRRSASR